MLRIWSHAAPMCDTNNKGSFFYFTYVRSRGCLHWYNFQKWGFKNPSCITVPEHAGIRVRCNVCYPGWATNVWRVCRVSVEMWLAPDITLRSDQPIVPLYYLQLSFCTTLLTPNGHCRFILAGLTNGIYQVSFKILLGPSF